MFFSLIDPRQPLMSLITDKIFKYLSDLLIFSLPTVIHYFYAIKIIFMIFFLLNINHIMMLKIKISIPFLPIHLYQVCCYLIKKITDIFIS